MLPAEDIERLAGFVRLEPTSVVDMCRIIHCKWSDTPLALGNSELTTPTRFSDPDRKYSVGYFAQSEDTVIHETLVRDHYLGEQPRQIGREELQQKLFVDTSNAERREDAPRIFILINGDCVDQTKFANTPIEDRVAKPAVERGLVGDRVNAQIMVDPLRETLRFAVRLTVTHRETDIDHVKPPPGDVERSYRLGIRS